MLSERGATIIDADVLARRAVELGTAAYDKIVARWGTAILAPDGHLDRAALRRVVFADHDQLEELNADRPPRGRAPAAPARRPGAEARRPHRRVRHSAAVRAAHDGSRSTESFSSTRIARVRLERLVKERGLRETEAMDMIAAQMPAELKRARADFVIDNDGTLTQLERRVQDVWAALDATTDVGPGRERRRPFLDTVFRRRIDSAPAPSPRHRPGSASCPTFRRTCCTRKTTST